MKRILFLLCLVQLLVCCSSDSTDTLESPVVIGCDPQAISASEEGGDYTVSVNTTHNEWTSYADDTSWMHVTNKDTNRQQGTIQITVDAHSGKAAREGHIIVMSGTARATITVSQQAKEPVGGGDEPYITPDDNITIPDGYQLVWNDEFNSGTAPNSSAWWYETGNGGWGNHEKQNYVTGNNHPDICYVKDGFLYICMQKVGSEVQSIRMNTSQSWQYGWFEARLRLPKGRGTWPAFWMMPKNFTSWPADGEIDIMEHVGYDPGRVYTTIHCSAYNGAAGTQKGGSSMVATAQSDFHVYAVEWTPQYIRGLVDGREHYRYSETGSRSTWPFDAPFYLKLNLAWGGDWGGAQGIDESALPATYQIDYVRVYQK